MEQPSEHIKFEVYYSIYLAEMTEIFNRRVEQCCSFWQVFLGASVFAHFQYGWLLGFLIALISAIQFVVKFGEKAGSAKSQVRRYRRLADELPQLDENQIKARLREIEETDTQPLTALYNPARKRAGIALYGVDRQAGHPLTRWEKMMAFIGGGIPK
ncbi:MULTISPECIES: hypothetical protein [Arsenophonus]|uniref:hypothetical protein n=1 Tax=Arsenophonus TaxID=637 RepID=UPI0015D7E29B|nr:MULTISPECIES: hypothetical protein [Arsenophonus]UBX30117.1 superinfection exclusion B family protein [Arsenophonus apicola]